MAKPKLNIVEVLITKIVIDSYICHAEFVNNTLREYDDIKDEIKNLTKTSTVN